MLHGISMLSNFLSFLQKMKEISSVLGLVVELTKFSERIILQILISYEQHLAVLS